LFTKTASSYWTKNKMRTILVETDEQKRACLAQLLALVIFALPSITRTERVEQTRRDILLVFLSDTLDESIAIMDIYARVDAAMNEKKWMMSVIETCIEQMQQGISQNDSISISILQMCSTAVCDQAATAFGIDAEWGSSYCLFHNITIFFQIVNC